MSSTVVVGAGLSGLFVAARLARAGRRVTVLERSQGVGGRARTRLEEGFSFNLGPHALYRAGTAIGALRSVGIEPVGKAPPSHALAADLDDLPALPFSPWTVATSPLLTGSERWELARWFGTLGLADPAALRGTTVSDWLGGASEGVRDVLLSIVRVSTYAACPDVLDAGATLEQLKRALRSVLYLDGGWQQLVDALRDVAVAAGAEVRTGARVDSVDELDAEQIVLCVAPAVAAELTGSAALARIAEAVVPVRASCLDVALRGELDPSRRLGLGLRRPLYASVHTGVARLGPDGDTLLHAAIYGGGERDEVEAMLDRMHPGWRERVVVARWRPSLVVCHDVPRAAVGGRRAPFAVADRPGVYVAGDWVGDEGWLADAALASAGRVCDAILSEAREAA